MRYVCTYILIVWSMVYRYPQQPRGEAIEMTRQQRSPDVGIYIAIYII